MQPQPPNFAKTAPLFESTPYEPLRPLGSGGIADVFEGRHRALHHHVAIKQMKDMFQRAARMKLEARVKANVRHPNTLPVTDFGPAGDGRPYYVMPFLREPSMPIRLFR